MVSKTFLLLLNVSKLHAIVSSSAADTRGIDSNPRETRFEDMPMGRADLEVGGGAINEKKRNFGNASSSNLDQKCFATPECNPSRNRAHLFHALEGLDRYPAYLSRWSNQDIETLEDALEARLEQVRSQKRAVAEKRLRLKGLTAAVLEGDSSWASLLEPPSTWDKVLSDILDPRAARVVKRYLQRNSSHSHSLNDVVTGKERVDLDVRHLEELMDEEIYDVYSFPLLSLEFCERLQGYVRAVTLVIQEKPMEYGDLHSPVRDLDSIGLGWLNDLLFHVILKPISRHLFQESETMGGELDWRQGYIAAYSASPSKSKPRERLVPHTDDSEVTMNVCIGDEFSGGHLRFKDLRGTSGGGRNLIGEYEPQIGRAILHSGRHFHEVSQVTSGDRFAYIMWSRSWNGVRAKTCACCWLNRRTDNNCVCSDRWN